MTIRAPSLARYLIVNMMVFCVEPFIPDRDQ